MAELAHNGRAVVEEEVKPPIASTGALGWVRKNLFGSIGNTILTLLAAWFLVATVPDFISWAFIKATWVASSVRECGAEDVREGACWAFIGEKWRFILFGRFPYAEQWRPVIVCLVFVGLFLASTNRKLWGRPLLLVWAGGLVLNGILMWGGTLRLSWAILLALATYAATAVLGPRAASFGVEQRRLRLVGSGLAVFFLICAATGLLWLDTPALVIPTGMTFVPTELWSGLPLTLVLAVIGMSFAFPLGIVLALGRRSHMPAVRSLCVAYIELIRGVPLISLLFMATQMLPLFLPTGVTVDKLLRAQIAIILFAAAYLAEVIRGGLQSLPKGQYEAASALGLSYWQATRLIILPQALAAVIPALVNSFIGIFKDTTLVLIVSLFDLLMTANNATTDPLWRGTSTEAYIFVAAVFWVFCYFMSKYSQMLEVDLNQGRRR